MNLRDYTLIAIPNEDTEHLISVLESAIDRIVVEQGSEKDLTRWREIDAERKALRCLIEDLKQRRVTVSF